MWKFLRKLFLKSIQEDIVTESTIVRKKSESNNKDFGYEDYGDIDWYDSAFDRKDAFERRLDYMEHRHNRGMW